MNGNSNLTNSVKEWFLIDEEIKKLKERIKQLTERKKELSSGLMKDMKHNNIDELKTSNGKLVHTEKKVRGSITKKYLSSCFDKFISDPEMREKLLNYIFDSREIKMVENIKRK